MLDVGWEVSASPMGQSVLWRATLPHHLTVLRARFAVTWDHITDAGKEINAWLRAPSVLMLGEIS